MTHDDYDDWTTPDFGRYEALFPIARGGMAEVFAVRVRGEGSFERYFAIKRVRDDLRGDAETAHQFLDEARLTACIASPYVVSALDLGRDGEGTAFFVMELVLGASVAELSARHPGPFAPRNVAEIGLHAARGLDAAHRAVDARGEALELVHRDVSPQNLLVGIDGRVRVADFGIAQAKQRLGERTQKGYVKGKFSYLAPEQLRGHCDPRTDVFALGVILWELATGRSLFRGATTEETLRNVRTAEIVHPSAVVAGLPSGLGHVIMRALRRDPRERFQSAAELRDALFAEIASGKLGSAPSLASLARDAGAQLVSCLERAAARGGEGTSTCPERTPVEDRTERDARVPEGETAKVEPISTRPGFESERIVPRDWSAYLPMFVSLILGFVGIASFVVIVSCLPRGGGELPSAALHGASAPVQP